MKKSNKSAKDLSGLIHRAKYDLHLSDEDIIKLPSIEALLGKKKNHVRRTILIVSLIFVLLVASANAIFRSISSRSDTGHMFMNIWNKLYRSEENVNDTYCVVVNGDFFSSYFRAPIDCTPCASVKGVKRLRNLSPEDFVDNYAFSMQPIIIEDAQVNWTAKDKFNFDFLKKVYANKEILERVAAECQFFPYQSGLLGLDEVFNMSQARVEGKEKPWYIGWSNCVGEIANVLRKYYKTPYFLPRYMDMSNIDWIFMGLPGWGAAMHIDGVGALSWQAQIRGTKKWTLQAPPECYGQCIDEMEIIVKPGETIVLDTNRWFHKTEIIGNETSIVIGSEYY